ncbi:MAG: hypothetical protein LBJ08_02555 [Bifidobacteriaceae bacterium]|jgi:hypothetical protein|nr:hypothetical protein [Bifidobacteriaceae bacterium]
MPRTHDSLDDDAALGQEVLDLLAQAGLHQRDLSLPPDEEERLGKVAQAALDQMVRPAPQDAAGTGPTRRVRTLTSAPPNRNARTSRPRRHRLVTAAVSGSATVAAGVVIALLASSAPTPAVAVTPPMAVFSEAQPGVLPLAGVNAADRLRDLAESVALASDDGGGDVQWVRLAGWWLGAQSSEGAAGGSPTLDPISADKYFLPDGTVRLIERRGEPLDPHKGLVDADGTWVKIRDEAVPGRDQGAHYAQTLSTDPATLTGQLVTDRAGCPNLATCVANQIADLHYAYVIPARVRAAMWLALAETQGMSFLGQTNDRLGRPALAFAAPATQDRQLLLYADQETGALLGSEVILVRDSQELGIEAPAVMEFTALMGGGAVKPGGAATVD